MEDETYKRKLTALLSADVAGYSRLMRDDEEATVRTLTIYRSAFIQRIQQYRGRVVDSPGDNILAEFISVVDAVNCAVEIQRELTERNVELSENRRMKFRIGINLGDVIEEGNRIYGDGINVAARLEGLAEVGGICISGTVYDAIENKIGIEYEYLGEHTVKNIDKPIRAYKVLSFPGAAAHRVLKAKRETGKAWRHVVFVLLAAFLVAGGAAVWHFQLRSPTVETVSIERMALPLPKKPSIAVLPFDNFSGDEAQEYIADGITESIIAGLAQVPQLFVIARNTSFTYKGKPTPIKDVGEALGVEYVLEGSVQKEGDRLRVTAQLINALTGRHAWAERYESELKELFDLQDTITTKIVSTLNLNITRHGGGHETDNFEAWSEYVKGLRLHDRLTKQTTMQARTHFENATRIDPGYVHAWIQQAWCHWLDARFGWSEYAATSIDHAVTLARKASELGGNSASLHSLMNQIHMLKGEFEKAIAEGEKAVEIEPNGSRHHILLAATYHYSGNAQKAIEHANTAMRLEPYYPPWFIFHLTGPYEMIGRYGEAMALYKQALDRARKGEMSPIMAHERLVIGYMRTGDLKKAGMHVRAILDTMPSYNVDFFRKTTPYKDRQYLDKLVGFLIDAGLPEKPPLPIPD